MKIVPSFIARRIKGNPGLSGIVDNLVWLFLDKVLRMGVGLIVGVWVARYLGPEKFGLLSFAQSLVSVFAVISTLGMQSIVVRDVLRDPLQAELTLGTTAVLQFFGGVLSFFSLTVFMGYMHPDDHLLKVIVAIYGSIMLIKAGEIGVYWFESKVQSKYTVWVQNSVFLICAIIKIALIKTEASIVSFAWIAFVEAAISSIILLIVLNFKGKLLFSLRVSVNRSKELLSNSWPLLLSGVVIMVQAQIDQIMLGHMVGVSEVGFYSAALRVIEIATAGAVILYSSFFPSIISAKAASEELYLKRIISFYRLNIIISVIFIAFISYYSSVIVETIFGDQYAPSAMILSLMSLRLIFSYVGIVRGIYFLNEGLVKFSAFTMSLGAVFNIGLGYVLIPHYKSMGAVVASLVSYVVATFIIDLFYSRSRNNSRLIIKAIFGDFLFLKKQAT